VNDSTAIDTARGAASQDGAGGFALDLLIYLSVMFSVRAIHFPGVHFLINGLFWSGTAFCVATWRMHARGLTWRDLGLRRPKSLRDSMVATALILAAVPIAIIIFEIVQDQLPFALAPDTSSAEAVSRFGDLQGNWPLFASIILLVWAESMLEELLDRGFLIHWFERTFSIVSFATILAVLLQAAIFGFRHSNDLSARSVSVGLIGLVMGIGYVVFGRNLWPLIVAHGVLNTVSMIGRVV